MAFALAWGMGSPVSAATAEPARDCGGVSIMLEQHGQRERDGRDGQGPRRSAKWWLDATDRAELGITDEQSGKLEAIFQSVSPGQRERWREHERLEPIVARLIKDGSADPGHVAPQVERIETLKAQMNAARIMMLYRMQQELSADQRGKLKRLLERRDAERRKSTDSPVRRY